MHERKKQIDPILVSQIPSNGIITVVVISLLVVRIFQIHCSPSRFLLLCLRISFLYSFISYYVFFFLFEIFHSFVSFAIIRCIIINDFHFFSNVWWMDGFIGGWMDECLSPFVSVSFRWNASLLSSSNWSISCFR